MINKIISLGLVLFCGGMIYETIKEEYPKVYQDYLKERSKWKWYKRMWYLK